MSLPCRLFDWRWGTGGLDTGGLVNIVPYAAERKYPKLFKQKEVSVLTVAPERTFWEKATILHHEANRPEHLLMPQRYSRHYYDLYCMAKSPIKEKAFEQLDLLQKVVDFEMKFYPRGWARYPEAVPATLKLLPPQSHTRHGFASGGLLCHADMSMERFQLLKQ